MITDKDIARQILQRDALNLYRQLPYIANQLGFSFSPIIGMMEDKILSYANLGIETLLDWLFGTDSIGDVDEASEIAKMITNDKIEEYRKRIRQAKEENSI